MAMQCNIDRRGKKLRLLMGIFNLLLAVLCLAMHWLSPWPSIGWIISSILLCLCGLFTIFEAYMNWCALRAMNIKTPL